MVKTPNGTGPAAKRAQRLWRGSAPTRGVHDGPLRLLSYLIAIGVPLAAYSAIMQGQGGAWPYLLAVAAPAVVLLISYVRQRLATTAARSTARSQWYER